MPRATCRQPTRDRHHPRSGVPARRSVPPRSRSDQPFGRCARKCLDTHTDRLTNTSRPRCMTARDRLRAWDVKFVRSSNLTHKSCGIFVASWGFAHCIGTRLVFHNFLSHRKEDKWNNAKKHKVLKMRLLIFTLAAFIRGSLEPQRLLIQIWRSLITDACKHSDKS